MAYSFCGFIGPKDPVYLLANLVSNASIVVLPQGLFVIPLAHPLIEEINGTTNPEAIEGFEYLTRQIETAAMIASQSGPVAYAEVMLFAGEGDQAGIIWQHGERTRLVGGEEVINSILRHLGIVASRRISDDGLRLTSLYQ